MAILAPHRRRAPEAKLAAADSDGLARHVARGSARVRSVIESECGTHVRYSDGCTVDFPAGAKGTAALRKSVVPTFTKAHGTLPEALRADPPDTVLVRREHDREDMDAVRSSLSRKGLLPPGTLSQHSAVRVAANADEGYALRKQMVDRDGVIVLGKHEPFVVAQRKQPGEGWQTDDRESTPSAQQKNVHGTVQFMREYLRREPADAPPLKVRIVSLEGCTQESALEIWQMYKTNAGRVKLTVTSKDLEKSFGDLCRKAVGVEKTKDVSAAATEEPEREPSKLRKNLGRLKDFLSKADDESRPITVPLFEPAALRDAEPETLGELLALLHAYSDNVVRNYPAHYDHIAAEFTRRTLAVPTGYKAPRQTRALTRTKEDRSLDTPPLAKRTPAPIYPPAPLISSSSGYDPWRELKERVEREEAEEKAKKGSFWGKLKRGFGLWGRAK